MEKIVYWHRELPPLNADIVAEHVVEATSAHVPGTLAHRDELWKTCFEDLMIRAEGRIEQEVVRLGGHYAHVLVEAIDTRRDDVKGESWLRGRFSYVLYKHPSTADTLSKTA